MIFPFKSPAVLKLIYPQLIWNIQTNEKVLYLTFDDGPISEVTEFVLDSLKEYNAKATFFCIGDNIRKHPEVFARVRSDGHRVANHTFNHLNGWKTKNENYFQNTEDCEMFLNQKEKFFRPPYGKIKFSQIRELMRKEYRIIMWDVLSRDFEQNMNTSNCLKKCIKHSKKGSIILFHDSVKAYRVVKEVLPNYLSHFSNLGYKFLSL